MNAKTNILRRTKAFIGLDAHVLATVVFRSWSILAGGATTLLIPIFLSPNQQGYYYTFAAVLATQVFFELGLNHVLVQHASYAAAYLQRVSESKYEGDERWRYAILSLIKLSTKWNAVMASLCFIVLLAFGSWFFSEKGTLPTSLWLSIWITLAFATAINLFLSARLAICEGLGEVADVARLRLAQSIFGYILLWLLLICNSGLWACVALPLASATGSILWLSRRRMTKSLNVETSNSHTERAYTYRRDIFPLQWRIALSWVSGYFIFNLLTPLVFSSQGEVAAGQLGLALTVFSAISIVGHSWISAKIPEFSSYIARNERAKLNFLFDHQFSRAISITILLSASFIFVAMTAGNLAPQIFHRLPPMSALVFLALSSVANTAVFSLAAYMRAHREEPLVVLSVAIALLISASLYLVAGYGLLAIVSTYAAINVFIALPWCFFIFRRYRWALI